MTGTAWGTFYPRRDHSLSRIPGCGGDASHALEYAPSFGAATGIWCNESTKDMSRVDAVSLVYDGGTLDEPVEVLGFPRVRLRASANVELAHWVVWLGDVSPAGDVALVTGAALNGSQRESRLSPKPLVPGDFVDLPIEMHFTSWTFQPGRRIRLAVSNGLFPMLWPTPSPMTTTLRVDSDATRLELPIVSEEGPPLAIAASEPPGERADAIYDGALPRQVTFSRDFEGGMATYAIHMEGPYRIGSRCHLPYETHRYRVPEEDHDVASYEGEEAHRIEIDGCSLELKTALSLRSGAESFLVDFSRRVFENGELVCERHWRERIPRRYP